MFHVGSAYLKPAARLSVLGHKVELFQGVSLSRCRPFLGKFGSYLDPGDVHLGLRSVASHLIGIDATGNVWRPSNKYWTLYVRVILDQHFDFKWWPGVELNHRHADFRSRE
jgi:hypothetical protein